MKTENEVIFIDFDQAQDLVDRIAARAENFNHKMVESEKEAMAQLLSDTGVKVSDLIDVSNLADNYAINAEIIGPEDYGNYNMKEIREDSLFSWVHDGEKYYCLNW